MDQPSATNKATLDTLRRARRLVGHVGKAVETVITVITVIGSVFSGWFFGLPWGVGTFALGLGLLFFLTARGAEKELQELRYSYAEPNISVRGDQYMDAGILHVLVSVTNDGTASNFKVKLAGWKGLDPQSSRVSLYPQSIPWRNLGSDVTKLAGTEEESIELVTVEPLSGTSDGRDRQMVCRSKQEPGGLPLCEIYEWPDVDGQLQEKRLALYCVVYRLDQDVALTFTTYINLIATKQGMGFGMVWAQPETDA